MLNNIMKKKFPRKKNRKPVKQLKIITYQQKTFQNPDIVDIKSVITKHPKTSHNFSKTMRKGEKVDSKISLYSDTKKSETFSNKKSVKITKPAHAFKGYASTYNVEILNSFNVELQFKDTEAVIKSKLIEILTQLKGFKFVTTLVLVLKKIENKDKTKYDNFYSISKAGTITNENDIVNVFQSKNTTIIENIRKSSLKDSGWIIDSIVDQTISNLLDGSSYIKLPKELGHPSIR